MLFNYHLHRSSVFDSWKVVGVDIYETNNEPVKYLVKLEPIRKKHAAIICNSEFSAAGVVISFGPPNYKTKFEDLPLSSLLNRG
jgi:hypothetical protein